MPIHNLRNQRRLLPFLLAFCLLQSLAQAEDISFNRDVRPILSENCFHCHGPDDGAREADLRLDTAEGAHDYAIVPSDPEGSELISRISSDDVDLVMPPRDSERALSAEQIRVLTEWVKQGAQYESHWSLIPPRRSKALPTDAQLNTSAAIDHLIRAGLDRKSKQLGKELHPAPPADRETLIRRLTFTLTGLPPTLEEIDAFLADDSSEAYSNLVDRLLESPRYGERMASDWLDVARYSDTYGYQVDRDRFVWPWRDWVIQAFNSNMPYDQFITEQLAGDLLPGATRDQVLATTFNRLHPQKVEGGSVPEEFRMEYVADRTQTVGTALMGLTLECCRCHGHKYDPIEHAEYYQFSAFFDNIDEAGLYSYFTQAIPTPTLMLPTDDEEKQLAQLHHRVAAAEDAFKEALVHRREAAQEWLRTQDVEQLLLGRRDTESDADLAGCTDADAEDPDSAQEPFFAVPILALDFEESPESGPNTPVDGAVGKGLLLTGDDPVKTKVGNFRRFEPFSVSLWIQSPDIKERAVIFHRSRAWTDAASRGYQLLIEDGKLSWSLIHFWPGNAIRVRTSSPIATGQWLHVAVTSDGSSRAEGLKIFIDGTEAPTEIVRDSLTKKITGGGESGDTIAIGERFRDRGFSGGIVDQFRVFDTELTELEVARLASRSEQFQWSRSQTEDDSGLRQQWLINHYLRRLDPDVARQRDQLKKARESLCNLYDGTKEIMVMRELPERRESYRLQRGEYDNRAEPVQPGTPSMLPAFPEDAPRNRLGLAQWLTRAEHPLTSRVAVNRLWQICFGAGLVRTPEDFGSQGEPPTHPELLDWLAVDLVESGWDVKRMLRQIVLSDTFRQSSAHPDTSVEEVDPENRLIARFPAHRLSAEMLRDNALAVSGRLVPKIGGPPVKPYEIEASFKPQNRDKDDGLYRRSLYTYWKRTGPAPAMMTLDASKRDVCRVRRERTSSPLQAFVLLNGPQYVEAARGLAERLTHRHADDVPQLLRDAFRTLTSHRPSDKQLDILTRLYAQQLAYFQEDSQRVSSFLEVGDAKADASLDQPALAAATVVIGTLLNFDMSVMNR